VSGFLSNWTNIASTYDAAGHGVRLMNSGVRPPDRVVSPDRADPGYIDSPYLRTPGALANTPWTDNGASFLSGNGGRR
jgi:hypothetical protein